MNFEDIKTTLPDYAKDIKLNLGMILTEAGAPGLSQKQILSIALACAFAIRQEDIIAAALEHANNELTDKEIEGAKAAALIMAMNNIYYRFTHVMTDAAYASMPANLRMNIMMNPGSDKISFELASMAVSALSGCGKCMNAHAAQLEKAGISKQGIQSAVRIASVLNAAALARELVSG